MKPFALRRGSPLLISAIALTVVLVTGAMLLVKSIDRLIQVNATFAPERLLSLEVSFSNATALSPGFDDRMPALFREFRNEVESLSGVESVAFSDAPLLSPKTTPSQFNVTTGAESMGQTSKSAEFRVVTPNYFQMMGTALARGRLPADTDNNGSAKVAVINTAMARLFGADPLGIKISSTANYGRAESYDIIGIVSEPRRFGDGEQPAPTVYVPFSQRPLPSVTVLVRTRADPRMIGDRLRSTALNLDPGNMIVGSVTTGEDLLSEATARTRVTTLLLSMLSAIALLLAIVGIYGFVSYHTTQRTREIAIRAALGGSRTNIVALVLRQGLTAAIIGAVIGLVGAYAFAKSIAFLLFDVPPADWTTFGAAVCLFLFVGAAASLIPALRAIHLDPVVALRHE
jgi:putative ABC transport system permease protein